MKEENKDKLTENNGKSKIKNVLLIIVVLIIICIAIFILYLLFNSKTNKGVNSSKENNSVTEIAKDKKNQEIEAEGKKENISESEIKKLSVEFFNVLNPMKNTCINNKIDKNCFSDEEINILVFTMLDKDQKFENKESLNEEGYEYNDYVSYDTFKQYVKRIFDIDNYTIPNDFSKLTQETMICHKYTNTGENIKRYTNVPGCSFGADGVATIEQWEYNYESYNVVGNELIINVVASYKYVSFEDNTGKIFYTDESKNERVDNEYDPKLKRLKYTFRKEKNYLTLLSIEKQS